MKKKKPQYVTRAMLARLRDEIEHVLDASNAELARARAELRNRRGPPDMREQFRAVLARVETAEEAVRKVCGVLGLEQIPRHTPVMGEQVSWRYFHVWVARINERLDRLEQATNVNKPKLITNRRGFR